MNFLLFRETSSNIQEKLMNIAWIGTGTMGTPMATHLIEAGHKLKIYNKLTMSDMIPFPLDILF